MIFAILLAGFRPTGCFLYFPSIIIQKNCEGLPEKNIDQRNVLQSIDMQL